MALRGIKQVDLLRRMHEIAAGEEFLGLREKSFSQQMLNVVENEAPERSYFTPIIAAALGVSSVWLQWGIGHPSAEYLQALPNWSEPSKSAMAPRGRRLAGTKSS